MINVNKTPMSLSDYSQSPTQRLIDIGIPEIKVTNKIYKEGKIIYDAHTWRHPEFCKSEKCSSSSSLPKLKYHDSQNKQIKDTPSEGLPVIIYLAYKRYKCPVCKKVYSDELTFVDKHSILSHRLQNEIIRRVSLGDSYARIALDYKIHSTTIETIIKKALHEYALYPAAEARIIGIDEAHVLETELLVISDIENKIPLAIYPDRKEETIRKALMQLNTDRCDAFTIDFDETYASLIKELFPTKKIIIDKFHVMNEINKHLNHARETIIYQLTTIGVEPRVFKNIQSLFSKNKEDLTEAEKRQMDYWFKFFPDTNLFEIYSFKEKMRELYSHKEFSIEFAALIFGELLQKAETIPEYKELSKLLKTHKTNILNYWNYPVTNAYAEALNGQIKKFTTPLHTKNYAEIEARFYLYLKSENSNKISSLTTDEYSEKRYDGIA